MRGLFLAEILECSYVIIGAFIGAGFISGKEIYLYFFRFGIGGIFNLFFVTMYLGYVLNKTIIIAQKNNLDNYDLFMDFLIKNKKIKYIFKIIINLFLLFSFELMMTGMCGFINDLTGIGKIKIFVICYFLFIIIFRQKIEIILKINKFLIPIIGIFLICIFFKYVHINTSHIESNYYFFPSFLYANFNLLCLIPFAVLMAKRIKSVKKTNYICVISSFSIFLLSVIVFLLLGQGNEFVWVKDFPIAEIIKKNNTFLGKFFDFIIMSAILTTAISQGYSYVEKYKNNKKMYKNKLILMLCVGIIFMQYSFSNVMEFVYPIFGCLGFILCGYIMLKRMD